MIKGSDGLDNDDGEYDEYNGDDNSAGERDVVGDDGGNGPARRRLQRKRIVMDVVHDDAL